MSETWPWPPELDALIAAPKHHTLVLENDRMRLLDTVIPVGDTVPVHTHRWPGCLLHDPVQSLRSPRWRGQDSVR